MTPTFTLENLCLDRQYALEHKVCGIFFVKCTHYSVEWLCQCIEFLCYVNLVIMVD